MKTNIAIIHDFVFVYAGAERVLEQMLACFPQADLFVLFDALPDSQRAFLGSHTPRTTFIQKMPWLHWNSARFLPYAVPFMPLAVEQIDLSGYDIVLSSSHSFAKGVITGPDQLHIAYTHSPMRFAWDHQPVYLRAAGIDRGLKSWLARCAFSYLRMWDTRTANGVDCFIANSNFIARRIWKVYRREAITLYPPIDVDQFPFVENKDDYYLVVSRLVPYKRIDLILDAFQQMPEKKLVVIGEGPERKYLEARAGSNTHLIGFQETPQLIDYMRRARAVLIAAEEDFGIAPIEAQACGTPVIAYRGGGVVETVRGGEMDYPTGLFFDRQEAGAIVEAIQRFEKSTGAIRPRDCRENARRFSPAFFRETYQNIVAEEWNRFQGVRQAAFWEPKISLEDCRDAAR